MTQEEEILSQQRELRRKTKEDAELLAGLVKHPGWARYIALIEAVGQNFNHTLNEPLENVMLVTRTEYAKGALKGLSLAATLPYTKMQEARELSPGDEEA